MRIIILFERLGETARLLEYSLQQILHEKKRKPRKREDAKNNQRADNRRGRLKPRLRSERRDNRCWG